VSATLHGRPLVVVTRHAKGHVIGPIFEATLGVRWSATEAVDTDRFGTFSGEVGRTGTPLEAALAKIAAGFLAIPDAALVAASEGSFGPAPGVPWVAAGHELVVLADRLGRVRAVGRDATFETNFAQAILAREDEARAFLAKISMPQHAVIVAAARDGRARPDLGVEKDLLAADAALDAVSAMCARHGQVSLETDMRAHRNATRRRSIARAAEDAARRAQAACPSCGVLGFGRERLVPGLACGDCETPTGVARAEELACAACGAREERPLDVVAAPAARCPACNP
jgi:hypothetical protein